jgi:hypothetical protein
VVLQSKQSRYLSQIQAEIKKESIDAQKRSVFKWTQIAENAAFDLEYHMVAAALINGVLRLD